VPARGRQVQTDKSMLSRVLPGALKNNYDEKKDLYIPV